MPKTDPDRLAGLTAAELALYNSEVFMPSQEEKNVLLNLAAYRASDSRKRALLEKHQYRNSGDEFDNDMYCVGCFASIHVPPGTSQSNIKSYTDKIVCKPDCALAAELKEGGE